MLFNNIVIMNSNVIINGKGFYVDQPMDSDIKRYNETGKLTPGQGEDYILQDVCWIAITLKIILH